MQTIRTWIKYPQVDKLSALSERSTGVKSVHEALGGYPSQVVSGDDSQSEGRREYASR